MVLINKGQSNTVALTLTERMINTSNTFVFKLTNFTTGETKVFAATDESVGTDRYNLFTWVESPIENLTNGTVSLQEGQWGYVAYEVALTSPATSTLSGGENILEGGIVRVVGTSTEVHWDDGDTTDTTWDG
jgi:hypothetical protein